MNIPSNLMFAKVFFRIAVVAGVCSASVFGAESALPPCDSLIASSDLPGWALGPFVRPPGVNPIIAPDKASVFQCPMQKAEVRWEALHTFNPAAVVRDGKVYVLYRAEDDNGNMAIGGHTSRLGLATSEDGIHFKREPAPVFFPADDTQKEAETPGGCEDPRIVESEDGTYILTYTQWNRKNFAAAIATSKDLRTWTKHGPAFAQAGNGKWLAKKYKSAGIVTQLKGGRLVAAKINGKYWMYWGESVYLATSDDLIHWFPVENEKGEAVRVLGGRGQKFDSGFPEQGPPPILTDKGVLVIYNGKNRPGSGVCPEVGPGAYSVGQALFDRNDPAKLIARLDSPFFKPEEPFEKSGQYTSGTTFAEGLVYFKNQWFMYYGCADSFVGVAICGAK